MADDAHKRQVFVVIEFLDATHCHETARTLEKETGYFFNLAYFEHCFVRGYIYFEEAEDYLAGFLPSIHGNVYSVNVNFELNRQKFLAVLDENDHTEAQIIIDEDLRPFERYHPNLVVSASELASLNDFRTHEAFADYGVPEEERMERLGFVRTNLEVNPLLVGKIQYPPPTPPQA